MASALQKSGCCSATFAAQLSKNCSATSVFACGMFQGWGLEGWSEDAMGGGKKRGVENLTNDTPPKKGFWTPPRTVRFPPPSGVSALFFLYKNPRQSRPEALLEGSKNFRESAFSGTFSSPHTFCTPPYHGPRWGLGLADPLQPAPIKMHSNRILGLHVQCCSLAHRGPLNPRGSEGPASLILLRASPSKCND